MEFTTDINLITIHKYSFTNENTGELVKGQTVYYTVFERNDNYLCDTKLCKCSLPFDYVLPVIPRLPLKCKLKWEMHGRYNRPVGIEL